MKAQLSLWFLTNPLQQRLLNMRGTADEQKQRH